MCEFLMHDIYLLEGSGKKLYNEVQDIYIDSFGKVVLSLKIESITYNYRWAAECLLFVVTLSR